MRLQCDCPWHVTVMKKQKLLFVLASLWLSATAFSAEDMKSAEILAVKAHDNGRIAFWEGKTPIYDGYPFYDITLSVGQKKYVVRYESLTGYYPSRWKVGAEIQTRVQGRGRIYLLNGTEEVLTEILNGRVHDCVPTTGTPTFPMASPQVPCE